MQILKSHRSYDRPARPGPHKRMRRAGVWLMVALLGASLAGAASAQSVKNPDTLVIVRISSPDSLDPAWADDIYSREPIAYMVYEPLAATMRLECVHLAVPPPRISKPGLLCDPRSRRRFHPGSQSSVVWARSPEGHLRRGPPGDPPS